jgi:hypothetical protein
VISFCCERCLLRGRTTEHVNSAVVPSTFTGIRSPVRGSDLPWRYRPREFYFFISPTLFFVYLATGTLRDLRRSAFSKLPVQEPQK